MAGYPFSLVNGTTQWESNPISPPASIQAGDIMLAFVHGTGAAATLSGGWSTQSQVQVGSDYFTLFSKTASASEGTYTGGAGYNSLAIVAYRGATGIDQVTTPIQQNLIHGSGSTPVSPAPAKANELLINFGWDTWNVVQGPIQSVANETLDFAQNLPSGGGAEFWTASENISASAPSRAITWPLNLSSTSSFFLVQILLTPGAGGGIVMLV